MNPSSRKLSRLLQGHVEVLCLCALLSACAFDPEGAGADASSAGRDEVFDGLDPSGAQDAAADDAGVGTHLVDSLPGDAGTQVDAGLQDALPAAPPMQVCGDGVRSGTEVCDTGPTFSVGVGACNPECSGYYAKKYIRPTPAVFSPPGEGRGYYTGDLGGIAGADDICQELFGRVGFPQWKALLVGGGRIASVSPFRGDGQVDWVIKHYTYYHAGNDDLVWRTDEVPLLGVRDGLRQNLLAEFLDEYPWGGWKTDWTIEQKDGKDATCEGWTSARFEDWGVFPVNDLSRGAFEPCSSPSALVCVEQ